MAIFTQSPFETNALPLMQNDRQRVADLKREKASFNDGGFFRDIGAFAGLMDKSVPTREFDDEEERLLALQQAEENATYDRVTSDSSYDEFKYEILKDAYDEQKKKAPSSAASDLFGFDSINEEYTSAIDIEMPNFNSLYDKAKNGDETAKVQLSDMYDSRKTKYMNWKYGEGKWNQETEKTEGLQGLISGVQGDIRQSVDFRFNNNRNFAETTLDAIVGAGGDFTTGTAELVTDIAGGSLSGVLEGIDSTREVFGLETDSTQQKISKVSDIRTNIKGSFNRVQDWDAAIRKVETDGFSTVTNFIAQAVPYVAGGYASGLYKVGGVAANATRGSLGIAESASATAAQNFFVGTVDVAADVLASSLVEAGIESRVTDEDYLDVFQRNVMLGGLIYGGFKGLKGAAAPTYNGVSSAVKYIGDTDAFKFTVKQGNKMKKLSSQQINKAVDGLRNAGVPIPKDGWDTFKLKLKDGIVNAYDRSVVSLEKRVKEVDTMMKDKEIAKLTPELQERVAKLLDQGVTLKQLKESHSIDKAVREIEDSLVNNYSSSNFDYYQQLQLDNIRDTNFVQLKKYMSQLGSSIKNIGRANTAKQLEREILKAPKSVYRDMAVREIKLITRKLDAIGDIKSGESMIKSNNSKVFRNLLAHASEKRGQGVFKKGLRKVNDWIADKPLDISDKVSVLNRETLWQKRADFILDKDKTIDNFFNKNLSTRNGNGKYQVNKFNKSIGNSVDFKSSLDLQIEQLIANKKLAGKNNVDLKDLFDAQKVAIKQSVLVDRQVAESVRSAARSIKGFEFSEEHIRTLDKLAELAENFTNKTHRASISFLIQAKRLAKDSGDVLFMKGDDIVVKQPDGRFERGNIVEDIDLKDLEPLPNDVSKNIDEAITYITEMSKLNDNIKKVTHILDEDQMTKGTYLSTIYETIDGLALTHPNNKDTLNQLKQAVRQNPDLLSKMNNPLLKMSKNAAQSTKKKRFVFDSERDAYFQKLAKNGDFKLLEKVRTRRDPFLSVIETASELPSRAKHIALADNLRAVRASNHIRVLYTPESIAARTKELANDIEYLKDAFDDIHGRSIEDTLEEVTLILGEKFDKLNEDFLNGKIDAEKSEILKSEISYAKQEFNQYIKSLQEQRTGLLKNGYVEAFDITEMEEFRGIFLTEDEAVGLRNLFTTLDEGALKTFIRGVQFQRQFIASGDLFLTWKTIMASQQANGYGAALKQMAYNKRVLTKLKQGKLKDLMNEEHFLKTLGDFAEYGGLQNIDVSLLFEPAMMVKNSINPKRGILTKLEKSKFMKLFKTPEEAQFKIMLPYAKATAWRSIVDNLLKEKGVSFDSIEANGIKREAGKQIDNLFSSQNWDVRIANSDVLSRKTVQMLPSLLFASDFFFSKAGQLKNSFYDVFDLKTVKGTIARRVLVNTALNTATMMQIMSYSINGHSTLENKNSQWWLIKLGDLKDNAGNDMYINPFGIAGQAHNLLNNGFAGIKNQLSVPLGVAIDMIKPDEFKYKDSKGFINKSVQTINEYTIPMSFSGIIDNLGESLSKDYHAYGTAKDMPTQLMLTLGDVIGIEHKSTNPNNTKIKMYDALLSPFKSEGVTEDMSFWEALMGGSSNEKLPSAFKANGLDGDNQFEQIQDVVNGKLSNFVDALERKDKDAANLAYKTGRTPKIINHNTNIVKALGALTSKYMQEGMIYDDARKIAIEEFKQEAPNFKITSIASLPSSTIKSLLHSDISKAAIDELFPEMTMDEVMHIKGDDELKDQIFEQLDNMVEAKVIKSKNAEEIRRNF